MYHCDRLLTGLAKILEAGDLQIPAYVNSVSTIAQKEVQSWNA